MQQASFLRCCGAGLVLRTLVHHLQPLKDAPLPGVIKWEFCERYPLPLRIDNQVLGYPNPVEHGVNETVRQQDRKLVLMFAQEGLHQSWILVEVEGHYLDVFAILRHLVELVDMRK